MTEVTKLSDYTAADTCPAHGGQRCNRCEDETACAMDRAMEALGTDSITVVRVFSEYRVMANEHPAVVGP